MDDTPVHKNNKFYITLIGNIRVKSKKKNYELFKVKKSQCTDAAKTIYSEAVIELKKNKLNAI